MIKRVYVPKGSKKKKSAKTPNDEIIVKEDGKKVKNSKDSISSKPKVIEKETVENNVKSYREKNKIIRVKTTVIKKKIITITEEEKVKQPKIKEKIAVAEFLNIKKYPFIFPANPIKPFDKDSYSWLSDLDNLIKNIEAIVTHPRMHLAAEKELVKAEVAPKIDNEGLAKTLREGKYWKKVDGKLVPEYVYTDTFKTDYCIYENRFIVFLIDKIYFLINSEINKLNARVAFIGKNYQYGKFNISNINCLNKLTNISSKKYVPGKKSAKSFLTLDNEKYLEMLPILEEHKKSIMNFLSTDFYKIVKKDKPLTDENVMLTNILNSDAYYSFCYNFYVKFKNKIFIKPNTNEVDIRNYTDYVLHSVLLAFKKLKFNFVDKEIEVVAKHAKLNEFKVENKDFTALITNKGENIDIVFKMHLENATFPKGKEVNEALENRLSLIPFVDLDDYECKNYEEEIKLKLSNGYDNCFIVSLSPTYSNGDTVVCSPYIKTQDSNIDMLIQSMMIFTEGSKNVYKNICPICGDLNSYDESLSTNTCISCGSKYSFISAETKKGNVNIIWLKRIKANI